MGIMVYFLVSVTEKLDNLTQFWRWPLGDGYGEGGSFERESARYSLARSTGNKGIEDLLNLVVCSF